MASDTQTTGALAGTPQQRHFSTPPSLNETAPSSYNPRSSVQSISKSNRLSTPSSLTHRLSLTSSRPAPPSPAVSRRTSTALSSVAVPPLTPSASRPTSFERRASKLPLTPTAPETPTPTANAESLSSSPRRSIQIRDYAFRVSISDPRALGLGEDVPKPNRVRLLNRKLLGEQGWRTWRKKKREERKRDRGSVGSIGSVASSQYSEDDWQEADMPTSESDEDDEDVGGWGNFDENDRSATTTPDDGDSYYPEDQDQDELRPGLYRAVFDFEPEAPDEMALQEDQIVRVVGRGGDGWAVVIVDSGEVESEKTQSQRHALVPAGYLEVVELDV